MIYISSKDNNSLFNVMYICKPYIIYGDFENKHILVLILEYKSII